VNNLKRVLLSALWLSAGFVSAQTTFTSLYVFGDGVSSTTDSFGPPDYHELRYCNGRVWVEVLSEWQNLSYTESANTSYYGQTSGRLTGGVNRPNDLLDNISVFVAPVDVNTSLFTVWVSNADFVEFTGIDGPNYDENDTGPGGDVETWATLIEDSIINHKAAISALYTKGVRTLVLPLAVDITIAPDLNLAAQADNDFIRARVVEFNSDFQDMLDTLLPTLPGLKIYVPDTFSFFDELVANPAKYGVTNPLRPPGTDPDWYASGYDVMPLDLDGPGAQYVFWDDLHPTAKVQMHLADLVQQMISPARISGISPVGGGYELEMSNVPVGRDGSVRGSGNLVDWMEDLSFSSISVVQDVMVPSTDPSRFFRLQFPVVWTWP